jgi:hypothetical protein
MSFWIDWLGFSTCLYTHPYGAPYRYDDDSSELIEQGLGAWAWRRQVMSLFGVLST